MHRKTQESGLIEIIPFDMHLNYLGAEFCFSPPCIPLGVYHLGRLQWAEGLLASTSFVYWNSRPHFFIHSLNWLVEFTFLSRLL